MKLEIYQDGKNQYGFCPVQKDYSLSYELRMMQANRPKSLLPIRFIEENGTYRLDYCLSGLVPFSELDEEERRKNLYNLLLGMAEAGKDIYRLLLKMEALCLDPEAIFLRKETGQMQFVYNPENPFSFAESIAALMEYIIKTTNPAREEDVLLIYGLYQKSREPNVTLFTLKEFWDEAAERRRGERKKEAPTKAAPEGKEESGSPSSEEDIYRQLGIDSIESEESFFSDAELPTEEERTENAPPVPKENSKAPAAKKSVHTIPIGRKALFRALEAGVALIFFALALFFLFFR